MSQPAYQGKYFAICLATDGTEYVAGDSNEVLIVPITAEGKVILTMEPSAAFGEATLILPGGMIEPHEDHAAAASRELQEEAGFAPGRLDFLGELRPFSKYLTTRSFVYLAHDLKPSKQIGDENYPIQLEFVHIATFEQLIMSGNLLDARVIAALYMARRVLEEKQLK